jgi:hypothetical protein
MRSSSSAVGITLLSFAITVLKETEFVPFQGIEYSYRIPFRKRAVAW